MRVLVTGSTGFVAQHLVPALAADHDVFALGHDARRIVEGERIEPIVADLKHVHDTELPRVDAVIHLAQANVPFPDGAVDLHAVNAGATVALLDHARRCDASHFVFASSGSVYGMADADNPWREEDATSATDFYAQTKLASEGFVRAYAPFFATATLRLVAPYGPGQRSRMIPRIIEAVRVGEPIRLNRDARPRMNPIYVDDVSRTVITVLNSSKSHVVNVAGNDVVSLRDIADYAGRALGTVPVFEETDSVSGDIVCDNSRLRALLGDPTLVSVEQGVTRVAAPVALH